MSATGNDSNEPKWWDNIDYSVYGCDDSKKEEIDITKIYQNSRSTGIASIPYFYEEHPIWTIFETIENKHFVESEHTALQTPIIISQPTRFKNCIFEGYFNFDISNGELIEYINCKFAYPLPFNEVTGASRGGTLKIQVERRKYKQLTIHFKKCSIDVPFEITEIEPHEVKEITGSHASVKFSQCQFAHQLYIEITKNHQYEFNNKCVFHSILGIVVPRLEVNNESALTETIKEANELRPIINECAFKGGFWAGTFFESGEYGDPDKEAINYIKQKITKTTPIIITESHFSQGLSIGRTLDSYLWIDISKCTASSKGIIISNWYLRNISIRDCSLQSLDIENSFTPDTIALSNLTINTRLRIEGVIVVKDISLSEIKCTQFYFNKVLAAKLEMHDFVGIADISLTEYNLKEEEFIYTKSSTGNADKDPAEYTEWLSRKNSAVMYNVHYLGLAMAYAHLRILYYGAAKLNSKYKEFLSNRANLTVEEVRQLESLGQAREKANGDYAKHLYSRIFVLLQTTLQHYYDKKDDPDKSEEWHLLKDCFALPPHPNAIKVKIEDCNARKLTIHSNTISTSQGITKSHSMAQTNLAQMENRFTGAIEPFLSLITGNEYQYQTLEELSLNNIEATAEISNLQISTLKWSGINLGNFTIQGATTKKLSFVKFEVLGPTRIINHNLGFPKGADSTLNIKSSDMSNISFSNVNMWRAFTTVDIISSNVKEMKYISATPFDVNSINKEIPLGQEVGYTVIRRDVFRQLKIMAINNHDRPQELIYKAEEMKEYRKQIMLAKGRYTDKFILWTKMVNNFGLSWFKAFALLLLVSAAIYGFMALTIESTITEWQNWRHLNYYMSSLLPTTSLSTYINALYAEGDTCNEFSERIITALYLLNRIVLAFFYFEIIVAFRKFGKE